jgi:hypothetical protein
MQFPHKLPGRPGNKSHHPACGSRPFYASVEQLLNPSLRGKPIVVGGGVVLAASYEAKSFGVGSGMSGWRARELCPQLIFVGGHFQDYQRLGDAAIGVLNDFTPLVERISIDEAFADVAGCTHLFGSPPEIARAVRRRVRAELGLPISIGVARTKHLAKICQIHDLSEPQSSEFLSGQIKAAGSGGRTRERRALLAMPRCARSLARPSRWLAQRAGALDSARSTRARACLTQRPPRNH